MFMNPFWLVPVLLAPFIGSFLGTLILRLPEGGKVVFARSSCPGCGRLLGPLDLVPLLSWFLLRGRCRQCGTAISFFYPAVELATLGIAAWTVLAVPEDQIWPGCILGWTLLALAWIDARDYLLPDVLTLPLIVAGLGFAFLGDPEAMSGCLIGAVAGFLLFEATRLAYRLLRRREGLGAGDSKLLAASGAWVSWEGLPSVILIAALAGLAAALLHALVTRKPLTARTRLSLGTFLALGTWIVWLYGPLVAEDWIGPLFGLGSGG
jgi:leader peptidase (prepilin peptidase) / N-methyltransferase